MLLSLAEVRAHLNVTTTSNDEELADFIDAAERAVVSRCGPLVATEDTERVRGGSVLVLERTPVLSLTSVTPVGGSALDASTLTLDQGAGLIEFTSGAPFGSRWYDVVYDAGHAATAAQLPDDLRLGILELIRHLWTTQRGGTQRPGSAPSTEAANYLNAAPNLFPIRVEQLLAPYARTGI